MHDRYYSTHFAVLVRAFIHYCCVLKKYNKLSQPHTTDKTMGHQFKRIIVVACGFLSSGVAPVSAKEGRHVEGGVGRLRTRKIVVNKKPKSANEPNGKSNGDNIIDEEDIQFWTRI